MSVWMCFTERWNTEKLLWKGPGKVQLHNHSVKERIPRMPVFSSLSFIQMKTCSGLTLSSCQVARTWYKSQEKGGGSGILLIMSFVFWNNILCVLGRDWIVSICWWEADNIDLIFPWTTHSLCFCFVKQPSSWPKKNFSIPFFPSLSCWGGEWWSGLVGTRHPAMPTHQRFFFGLNHSPIHLCPFTVQLGAWFRKVWLTLPGIW